MRFIQLFLRTRNIYTTTVMTMNTAVVPMVIPTFHAMSEFEGFVRVLKINIQAKNIFSDFFLD